MRKALSLTLFALLFSSTALASTMRIKFQLPTMDNSGTCSAPVLVAMGSNPYLKGHWRWWIAGGDSLGGAIEDSLTAPPGATIIKDYQVPAALFRIRVWATDMGGIGCDTLVSHQVLELPPAKPKVIP